MQSLGVEIEMPVASRRTGASHKVGPYFENLAEIKRARRLHPTIERIGDVAVAVHEGLVVSGLDNAFNNLESAFGPFIGNGNLDTLQQSVRQELADVAAALDREPDGGAMVINFSEHPLVHIDPAYYTWIRSPKGIYDYWVGYRGWEHMAGVDAKAHNGPTTGVSPIDAVRSLNVLLASSACFIALYANSPFEDGDITGLRENRLSIWPRMFKSSRFACDRFLHCMPQRPFQGWGDYFHWMFGPGTNMQFLVPAQHKDYKKPSGVLVVEGDPCLLDFLHAPSWAARPLCGGDALQMRPCLQHLEFQQYCNFLDARLRFGFQDALPLDEFLTHLDACQNPAADAPPAPWSAYSPSTQEQQFSAFMDRHLRYAYIEGRAAGANQADAELTHLDDTEVAASVVCSASALQHGLLHNLHNAHAVLARHPWSRLRALREEAVRHGMAAVCGELRVDTLCADLLEVAADGLPSKHQWLLSYPRHVLKTGRNGADRALEAYERMSGGREERLLRLVRQRAMVLP